MENQAVRAVQLFEFYVGAIWPLHRLFVKGQYSRRCRRCAASEKMLPLNAEGVCSLCLQQKKTVPSAGPDQSLISQLSEILSKTQHQGPLQYDALVLYSGGKDSTFLIEKIRRDFPRLRMLAFTIDNGFMSPIAQNNVKELIGQLNIDHIFIRPKKSFYVQLFRYALTHLNADGSYGTVDFSDGEFLLDTARRLATEKRIPLILCGYSKYQVQNGLKLHHFESPRERELADRTETAGLPLKDIFKDEELNNWWRGSQWPSDQVARLLFPLYAWDLEESEIKKQVREWGLMTAKEYSPAVTNHQLIPLLAVTDVHQKGFSSFEYEFCRMIREGKADLKQWLPTFEFLEYTARTGMFMKPAVLESLKILNLSLQDVGIHFGKEKTK